MLESRSNISEKKIHSFLRTAVSNPYTFYGLKQQKLDCSVSEAKILKPRCWEGHIYSGVSMGEYFLACS